MNESVGASSTFKAFLNVHTLLYFSFDDFFCANKAPPTMFLEIMQPSAVVPKTNRKSITLNIQQGKLTPSPDEDQQYIVKTLR